MLHYIIVHTLLSSTPFFFNTLPKDFCAFGSFDNKFCNIISLYLYKFNSCSNALILSLALI